MARSLVTRPNMVREWQGSSDSKRAKESFLISMTRIDCLFRPRQIGLGGDDPFQHEISDLIIA